MITDFQSEVAIKKSTGWVIALSICLIILGGLAIIMPGIASAFFTVAIGWITLISGIVMIVQVVSVKACQRVLAESDCGYLLCDCGHLHSL